jgi:hypothetical protein
VCINVPNKHLPVALNITDTQTQSMIRLFYPTSKTDNLIKMSYHGHTFQDPTWTVAFPSGYRISCLISTEQPYHEIRAVAELKFSAANPLFRILLTKIVSRT